MRAGTIVASNYSAMADLLGRSFLTHHPSSTFTVLVVDDGLCEFADGIDVARLDDLDIGVAALDVMKTVYDVMEFATSVKPSFLRLLLDSPDGGLADNAERNGPPVACYLDPDIVVYAPFDDQVAPALDHGVVLTPHALQAVPRDGCQVSEGTIMQSGMYNCGFLAVGPGGQAFLDWWDERLRFDAVVDFERSHFTDQRWVDWVPSLFDHMICRDPGMNVAWWNIHERPVSIGANGSPEIGDLRVRFAHFSGYDPMRPEFLSKHQATTPRVAHRIGTGMRTLADDYATQLTRTGHSERKQTPYQWDTSIDGIELTPEIRRRIRAAILEEVGESGVTSPNRVTPDAFGGGASSLSAWLAAADSDPSGQPPGVIGCQAPVDTVAAPGVNRGRQTIQRVAAATDRLGAMAAESSRFVRAKRHPRSPSSPFAFLHVPKSAGSSIVAALRESMTDHRWGDYVFDPAWMGPYRNEPRPPAVQHQVLESPEQLARVDAVAGHLKLDTLLRRFEYSDIATVVREPRCRLLSHYEYWRALDGDARDRELPWASSRSALTLDFADWLMDESIAYQSDNTLIRQLVEDDAIPDNEFIPNDQLRRLARIAVARVRKLGWVGLVELGDATWDSLSAFVGAPLHQRRINITAHDRDLAIDLDRLFSRAVPALAARTGGDSIVWHAAALRVGVANPAVHADEAWMRRLGHTVQSTRPV
jgi:hypothetical protein